MIKSADGSAWLLHEITKPTVWRGELQILKEEEEDAKPSKDEDHGRCDKNDQTKRQNGPEWRLAVSESLAADCKNAAPPRMGGRTKCGDGTSGYMKYPKEGREENGGRSSESCGSKGRQC